MPSLSTLAPLALVGPRLPPRKVAALALLFAASLSVGCSSSKKADPPPPPAAPVIGAVSPGHGTIGALVTVTATGLGIDPAAITVTFQAPLQGTMTAAPLALGAGTVQVVVPGALAESAQLTVTVAGRTSAPVPFTIDALTDPTPAGASEVQLFFTDVDAMLARLLPILDTNLVPLLEQTGQVAQATSVRSGLAGVRSAFSQLVSTRLAGKTPEQLAAIDAFFASPAAAAVRQELQALIADLPVPPAPPTGLIRASVAAGMLGGFSGGAVEDIEAARRFLGRARDTLDKLDWALIGAIAACAVATGAGAAGAAALIPIFEEIREMLVKPLLRLLDAIIPLMGSFPTKAAGGTLRIQVTDHPLWIDQEFGSMSTPFPLENVGAVLVTEPYGVKGYLTFKNDGGQSLRQAGADLLPSVGPLAAEIAKFGGFDIGAMEVTDAETRLRLIASAPGIFQGTWDDPVLRIAALQPGLAVVTLRADLDQVKETCPNGVDGRPLPGCIVATAVQVQRTMRAIAGVQVAGPYTQGPRVDSAQVAGQPPSTGFLGDDLVITGEGFSTNAQLAPQDVMFTPAPGYPGSGEAGSPSQRENRFATFRVEIPDALSGPATVVLNGSPSNPFDMTILPPVLDAPPPSAIVGEAQRFTGRGFSKSPDHNEGDWAGFRAPALSGNHTVLDFVIPSGAASGPFKVVTLGQLISNVHDVTVRRWSEPSLLSHPGALGLRPVVAFDRQSGRRLTAWVERNGAAEFGDAQLVASVLLPGAARAGTPVVLPARLGGHPAAPPRPAVAAANGWFYLAWVEQVAGGNDRVVVARSQDGVSWSAPAMLSDGARPASQPALGADLDVVVAAWVDEGASLASPAALRVRRSLDGGATFLPSFTSASAADVSDPAVAVKGGAVALAWSVAVSPGRAVTVIRSEDGGATFGASVRFGGSQVPASVASHPSLALGPSCVTTGVTSVYLAWEFATEPDRTEDVAFVRLDAESTFAQAVAVNLRPTPGHSQSPQLVVDEDCIPAVAWLELGHSKQALRGFDSGATTAAPNPAQLVFARSFDDGATFNPQLMTLAQNLRGDRLGHLSMAGGGRALLTAVHQDDFGGSAVAIRTTDGLGGSPLARPPGPSGELATDLVYRAQGGELWASRPDGGGLLRLTRGVGTLNAPGPSPDGRWLAWVAGADQTFVAEADGAHPLRVTVTADFVWRGDTTWSPGGDWLAVGAPYAPATLGWVRPDATGFAMVGTASGPASGGPSGTQPWSPDGRLVLGGDPLQTFDPNSGTLSPLATADPAGFPGVPTFPAWSPDGARLALVLAADPVNWAAGSLGAGDLYLYDVVLGTLVQLTTGGLDTTPAWSPDGTRLAFVRTEGVAHAVGVKRIDTPPGDEVILSNPFLDDDTAPSWLPDGGRLLVVRRDAGGTNPVLTLLDPQTGASTLLALSPAGPAASQHLGVRPTWAPTASAAAAAAGSSALDLVWTPATDNLGVAWYQVWSNGTLVVDLVPGNTNGTTVTGLLPGSTHTFIILACDAAGNCTLTGPSVTGTTGSALSPPTWVVTAEEPVPYLRRGTAWSPGPWYDSPYDMAVHWTPANEPNVEYRFHRNGAAVAEWVSPYANTDSFSLTGLVPLTTYTFTVQACHKGTEICTSDGPSLPATTLEDTSPPNLMAGSRVLASLVTLSFDEPLDATSTPAPGDFTFSVLDSLGNLVPRPVQAVAVNSATRQVILTLAEPCLAGEVPYVAYTPGAAPLRNTGGVASLAFGQNPTNDSEVTFNALATAPNGDVLVAGRFTGAARFGTILLLSAGQYDGFVARRSAAGWLWARPFGGAGFDEVFGLALDAAGEAVIGGAFSGTISVPGASGPLSLVPNGAADAFVARLDASGTWEWVTRLGGAGSTLLPGYDSDAFNGGWTEWTAGVAIDAGGAIYATGTHAFTATVGGTPRQLVSNGLTDAWVGKLDASGNWLWATGAGSATGSDVGAAVASDGVSVFVTGQFNGAMTVPGLASGPLAFGYDLFMARLDAATGSWSWARAGGEAFPSLLPGGAGRALALAGDSGVYLAGSVGAIAFGARVVLGPSLSRWTAAGLVTWEKHGVPSNVYDGQFLGVAVQGDGSVLAAGSFKHGLSFPNTGITITGNPISDGFGARFSAADGTPTWAWATGNELNPSIVRPTAAGGCGAGRICLASTVTGQSGFATASFGVHTTPVLHDGTLPFVARLGTNTSFPAQGDWFGLFGLADGP